MKFTIITILIVGVFVVILTSPCSAQSLCQVDGLDSHNSYRWWHGSPNMNLDPEMCRAAQDCAVYYARRKQVDHSCKLEGMGENLYMQWQQDGNPNLNDVTKLAIKLWYDENATYNYQNPGNSRGVTGHFTQIVWKESTSLGIGSATVDGYTVIVAKYKPWGNVRIFGNDEWIFYRENVLRPNQ